MKWKLCIKGFAAAATVFSGSTIPTYAALNIEFDYSYDSGGFFTAPRKALLEAVASVFEARIEDSLGAITPGGSNHWTTQFYNPGDGSISAVNDPSIAANTLKIYVGARSMSGGTLGVGGYGGVSSGAGSPGFVASIDNRGQTGSPTTDFAPWGGSIAFNSTSTWYFDADTSTTESFAGSDFYSVALHEVGHLLGLGTAPSWEHWVNGSDQFTGAHAVAEHGGNVPLESDHGHFQEGTASHVAGTATSQEAALDPTINVGTRKKLTDLDWAALQDVGWEVTPVPEPTTYAFLALGALVFFKSVRRKAV